MWKILCSYEKQASKQQKLVPLQWKLSQMHLNLSLHYCYFHSQREFFHLFVGCMSLLCTCCLQNHWKVSQFSWNLVKILKMWYGIFNNQGQRMIYNNFSCITWFITIQKLLNPTILRIKYKLFTIAYSPLRALPLHLFPTSFPKPFSSLTRGRCTGLLPVLQKAPSSLVECGCLSQECSSPCPWYVCLFFIFWVSA